jgi:hypothetical protein
MTFEEWVLVGCYRERGLDDFSVRKEKVKFFFSLQKKF